MPTLTSPWRNPIRKLIAVCRRLDDHWVGDLLGVIFLFALIPLVLFAGLILEAKP